MSRVKSVLTDDMGHCMITGAPYPHIHHIFPGSRRRLSDRYGFVVPLAPDLHNMSDQSVHMRPNEGLDLKLKQMAQTYYEIHYGTRDEFREEFGKSWL